MAFDKRKALQNALTFAQQGKWDKAIAEYQAILRADPADLTVCNNLGDLYARAGRVAEAIEQYLKLGESYRADGLSVKAIAVYKKIVKLDANRTEALLACADLYEEQGLSGEAKVQLATVAEHYAKAGNTRQVIEIYRRLGQLDPTNHALLTRLADLLLKEGMREDAAAEYERAAQAAEAAGLVAESKRLFKKVRELSPESPQANLALAEQHLRESKYAEAVEALLKTTAGDSSNAQGWRLLGEAYVGLGQAAEAIAALEQAVGLGLPEADIRRPLAKALMQEGRTDEGITLCQKLSEEALSRGRPEEAIATCRDLLTVAPHLAPVHAYLVRLLQNQGRDAEAREAIWALAAAHEACGETEAAVHVYHQLLELDPTDAEAQARLEVLEGESAPPAEEEDLAALTLDAAPAGEGTPGPVPEEAVSTEPPDFELSLEDALLAGPEASFETGGGFELEPRPSRVFELDESGELAGIRYSPQEPHGGSLDQLGRSAGPVIELAGEGLDAGLAGLAGVPSLGEEEESGEVAEQLAEAEVYLKYGLAEKARERLLEVVRLAPESVVARRRLKDLYLEQSQVGEACEHILALARVLAARGHQDAARREIQEGLRLAPDHAELTGALAGLARSPVGPPAEGGVAAAPVDAAAIEAPAFEIPESLEMPAGASLPGELPQDFDLGAVPMGEVGGDGAAPSEGELGLHLPEVGGAEPGLLSLSPETGLGAEESTPEEEELPADLQALLEEPEEAPALVVEVGEGDLDQTMADDLTEAEFYLSQGMVEEARAVHRRMQARGPLHPAAAQLGEQLAASAGVAVPEPAEVEPAGLAPAAGMAEAAVSAEAVEPTPAALPDVVPSEEPLAAAAPPVAPVPASRLLGPPLEPVTPKFTVLDSSGEAGADDYVNLGAELEEELAAEDRAAASGMGAPLVEDLLKEFQKGVREQLDEKDFETHYNLGIAYKEMDLYDEAIQEFRLATHDPGRTLTCANLLGLCYLAKGDPDGAIREFRAGLEVRGHPREAYHGLRYDLGVAYEALGDLGRALESFETVHAENPRFQDVRKRVKDLRERLPRVQAASVPTAPAPTGEPPKRAKDHKKKISFI